jgi:hypothetical protein
MCMLTRRLVVLLDDDRYAKLEDEARRRRVSVAVVVRDALDRALESGSEQRQAAIQWLLDAPPLGDVPDVDELRRELDEIRAGDL